MSDRSDSYKYTNKMMDPPTRDESRFNVKAVTNSEFEAMKAENEKLKGNIEELTKTVQSIEVKKMKEENEDLKARIAELTEIVHKIVASQSEANTSKKR